MVEASSYFKSLSIKQGKGLFYRPLEKNCMGIPLETPHPLKNAFNYHVKTPSLYTTPLKFNEILNTLSP